MRVLSRRLPSGIVRPGLVVGKVHGMRRPVEELCRVGREERRREDRRWEIHRRHCKVWLIPVHHLRSSPAQGGQMKGAQLLLLLLIMMMMGVVMGVRLWKGWRRL